MAINKEGTSYTFTFSIIMVVIVAALLSTAAMSLKPFQKNNQDQKKMQDILAAIRVTCDRSEAPAYFEEYIKEQLVLDLNGNLKDDGKKAFDIDIQKEFRSLQAGAIRSEDMNYPMYVCNKNDTTFYLLPVVGKGLWGPIWGFIALNSDMNTVYGATFDHQGETPGLGAEIKQEDFQLNFRGEKIFDDEENFVSVRVIKGGAAEDDLHGVDAITGGTITSDGVSDMVDRTLKVYVPYFKKMKAAFGSSVPTTEMISDSTEVQIQTESI